MNSAAWIALVLFAVFAIGDWVSRARDAKPLEYVCKPAALAALIAVAVLLDPAHSGRRAWFVAALVFSLAGDVFLMLPRERFVEGLLSFLVAHVCFVIGLVAGGVHAGWVLAAVPLVLAAVGPVAVKVLRSIRAGNSAEFAAPVAVYISVISVMVVCAIGSAVPLAGAGAVAFAFSDSLIAWSKFVRPVAWASVGIMVTYHLGQLGLTLALTHS